MQEQLDLAAYLIKTLDVVRNTHPDCGIVLLGDFNNLDISEPQALMIWRRVTWLSELKTAYCES